VPATAFGYYFSGVFDLTCLAFSANMLALNPISGDRKVIGEWLPFLDSNFVAISCTTCRLLIVPRRKCGGLASVPPEQIGGALEDANYLRDLGLTARMSSADGAWSRSAELTPAILLPLIKSIDLPTCLEIYNICALDLLTRLAQTADRGNRL
jgi:hypothetical protein